MQNHKNERGHSAKMKAHRKFMLCLVHSSQHQSFCGIDIVYFHILHTQLTQKAKKAHNMKWDKYKNY